MTKHLIVHAGLPKTGSTALQDVLSSNARLLADLGLQWTDAIRGTNHVQLPAAFTPIRNRRVAAMGILQDRDQRRMRKRLKTQLSKEASSERMTLVSSEHLAGLLRRSGDIAHLADFLSDIFDSCQVVMFLRRGDHWLPSAYAEAVAGGFQRPFDERFVRSRRHLLDHTSLLQRWATAFGASSVDLLPYLETDKVAPHRIPIRFLDHLGVGNERVGLSSASLNTSRRPSPTVESIEVLRRVAPLVRRDGLRPSRQRNSLRQSVTQKFPDGTPLRLTPRAHRALEKAGWIHTGVEKTANAKGDRDLWSEWAAQDPAEISDPPPPDETEIQEVVDATVHSLSAGNQASSSRAAWLRRTVIRIFRR